MSGPLFFASLLAAALLTAPAQVQVRAQSVVKEVLILHGGPEGFPGTSVFDESLRAVLLADPAFQIDAHSEYLENEEFGETADPSLLEYLRIKFADRRPDLVIANAAPAVAFVLRHRDKLFPNVPVVFISAVEPTGLRDGTLRGVTGVLRQLSQVETVELALRIHPATRRLHVIAYAPAVAGFQEPSLVFALGKDVVLTDGRGAADAAAARGGLALVENRERGAFLARLAELQDDAVAEGSLSGFNYSRGRRVHVTVYRVGRIAP